MKKAGSKNPALSVPHYILFTAKQQALLTG